MGQAEGLLRKRKGTNAKAGRLDDDQGTGGEVGFNRFEIRQQDLSLALRASLCSVAKQDDRGRCLPARCEQRAEIRVGRDDYALLLLSAGEDRLVGRRLEVVVADMDCIVASALELFGKRWRKRVVDKEPHPETRSGNSRSRTASAA